MERSASNSCECLQSADADHRLGKHARAVTILQACLRTHGSSNTVRTRLASLYLETDCRDDAIVQLVRIQETLAEQGDRSGAISVGSKVVALDPKFDNPLSYVAKVNLDRLRGGADDDTKAHDSSGPGESFDQSAEEHTRVVAAFKTMPLLAELEPDELVTMAKNLKIRRLEEGEILFEKGDTARCLFFVVKGMLEASSDGNKLGLIRSGECLGEFALLTGQARSATIRALARSEMLELSPGSVDGIVRRHPRVRELLMERYRQRALVNVLAQCPLFSFMEPSERKSIAEEFEPVTLRDGEAVFQQGQEGGALYLVKSGQCVVASAWNGAAAPIELAILGATDFFGEVSFLTGVARTATVTARGDCELLRAGESFLRELTAAHPHLDLVLKQFHIDRMTQTLDALKHVGV